MSSSDFVSVNVRLKPARSRKSCKPSLKVLSVDPPVLFSVEKNQTFNFDRVFTEETSQNQIYDETVKPLVEKVKEGYNCTILAYGQTGTGKTYTMGTNPHEENSGIISRALEDFFSCDNDISEYDVCVSFLEIYNEKVFDLLKNDNKVPLQIRGLRIDGLSVQRVFNVYESQHLLEIGGKNRHTGETKQNMFSSRSHAIFSIHYTAKYGDKQISSKLNLVDLAGSESVKKTETHGKSFLEGVNINKGLLCIGQVMTALSENCSHIPYRQSIITTILQDSLNKNNYISLIACVKTGMEDTNESLQTLEFAQRVKKMRNKPEVNEIVTKFKTENPTLFEKNSSLLSYTPMRKPAKESTFKTPKIPIFSMPPQPSDYSRSSSILSASNNDATLNNFSPIFRKYMNEFEEKLNDKMQNLMDTIQKRNNQRVSSKLMSNSNENSPWSGIKRRISKLVHETIVQHTTKRATSSPIDYTDKEHARKILDYESPVLKDEEIFKKPKGRTRKPKKVPVKDVIELPEVNVRRSARISMRRDSVALVDPPRRSMRTSIRRKSDKINENCNCSRKIKTIDESLQTNRNKEILRTLNVGDSKELRKLPTIGLKTAERILLFRQMKKKFKSIEELADLPGWSNTYYQNFLKQNFVKI